MGEAIIVVGGLALLCLVLGSMLRRRVKPKGERRRTRRGGVAGRVGAGGGRDSDAEGADGGGGDGGGGDGGGGD